MNISTAENQDLECLFKDISKGNVILFLGAGASVTDSKKYLSKQLIEYYRDIRNISYEPNNDDIVDFVDKVFSIEDYNRNDFDFQVSKWLKENLVVQQHHKSLINIPWLSIFSTNIDLIIENTIECLGIENSYEIIRSIKEFDKTSNIGDKTKFIKLHGCISDISNYKLIFSTSDFEKNSKYYKRIYNVLGSLSNSVKILFIGYSFSDSFGKLFLNDFGGKLKGRECFLVDPFLNDDEFNLSYLKSKNIIPIKSDVKEFIDSYHYWYVKDVEFNGKPRVNVFKRLNGSNLDDNLQHRLRPFIIPLNNSYDFHAINAKDFYMGEEPNYNVIRYNYDVIKEKKIKEVYSKIINLFTPQNSHCPFIFLSGSYGTGKTTFTYRLIQKLVEENSDLLAFEIIDPEKISDRLIFDLIDNLRNVKKIIFYSNYSELDLNFKKIRELRGVLSSKQFEDKSIIFLQSIRENALERFKKSMNPKIDQINIDSEFSDKELELLIELLNNQNLISYRGEYEKKQIIKNLKLEIGKHDHLLIFLRLIKDGKHKMHILNTYNDFKYETTKKAFLYTSLLYRFGIKMPVSLLKEIIDKEWDEFINEVIKVDGKGIFIQEKIKPDNFLRTDLFFKIKHSVIAESFIKSYIKERELFKYYRNIISKLPSDDTSVYTFLNLIRSLIDYKIFDNSKINNLYDIAYTKLSDFIRFNIYYTRNLELRKTKESLEKGLSILDDAEQNSPNEFRRDSRIIHRKACLNYQLSKFYFRTDLSMSKVYYDEAFELFEIKLAMDPSSIFSYLDFIYLLTWYSQKWDILESEKVKTEIKILYIVEKGISNLQEGISKLLKIKNEYINKQFENPINLNERIDNLIDDVETRPYALLLKCHLVMRNPILKEENDINKIVNELEYYSYFEEIALFLFHYYGNNLNNYNLRMKYFDLIENNKFIIEKEELDYLYYSFISESYSFRFRDAFQFQKKIYNNYKNSIKKEPLYWKEQDNDEKRIFEGKIVKNAKGYFEFKVLESGSSLTARIDNRKVDYSKYDNNNTNAHLYFTYTGIWGEII